MKMKMMRMNMMMLLLLLMMMLDHSGKRILAFILCRSGMTMMMTMVAHGPSRKPMIRGRILRKSCNLFGLQDAVQECSGGFMKCVGQCFARFCEEGRV